MKLQDKVIILTGGNRGIGYAVAKGFLEQGAKLVLTGTTQERADEALAKLTEELAGLDFDATALAVDIRSDEQVTAMVETTMAKYGKIDVLVNNAGITSSKPVLAESVEMFSNILDTNVLGTFRCIQAVAPIMKEQGYGNIINTTSIVGTTGGRGQAAYASSKFALNGLTKCCAKDLGGFGIRVNALAPGCTMTDMLSGFPEQLLQQLAMMTPIGRVGESEDMVGPFIMLASDESKFMTGSIVSVDGGITL